MGFEANGVPGGGTPGGGDLTGTLIAGRIPVANGIKSLTSSDSTYIGGVLTLKAVGSVAKVTIDASANTTIDGSNVNINTSSGFLTLNSAQSIYTFSSNILANRVAIIDAANRLSTTNVTPTEINHLTGVTSNVQIQLNGKISGSLNPTFIPYTISPNVLDDSASYQTPTALVLNSPAGVANVQLSGNSVNVNGNQIDLSTGGNGYINITAGTTGGYNVRIVGTNLTATTVPYMDSNNYLVSSSVTPTELNHLTGVTSNIQVQINGKMTNPMTTIGDMIQATTAGAPVRIAAVATGNVLLSGGVATANAWGKVGLTTHVTGILPEVNGGTGTSVVPLAGSIPFQGASSAYTYDYTNFNYNSVTKTLNTHSIYTAPGAGINGHTISIASGNAAALDISSAGSGISITSTNAGLWGINVVTTGLGTGVMVDSTNGIAGSFNSKFFTAGLFTQTGVLTVNNTSSLMSLNRDFSLGAFDATGAILNLNDSTSATGNFVTVTKQGSVKVAIKSTGVLQYIDGNQAAGKVLTSDASGNATWQTGGGGATYTFSTGLTNTSNVITANLSTGVAGGQSAIGGTAASNSLTLSSTTNGTKGRVFFGSLSCYSEFNDRLGLGVTTPGAKLDVYIVNGGTGSRIVNSDATTAAGTVIGWYWSPTTNGTDTNIDWNEQNAAPSTTKRAVWHKGGNFTIGPGTGNGDAKLHVIGTVKIADGSQGAGKVFTSDANGLGTWTTPSAGFANPMTTIADIIQANTGGTPQRLAGSATAGTFLRSQGTGVLNHWSTLVLPNSIIDGCVPYATASDTIGSSLELVYLSSAGQLLVTKSATTAGVQVLNSSTGTSSITEFKLQNSFTNASFGLTSSGFTGTIGSVSIGANRTYLLASSGGLRIFGGSTTQIFSGSTVVLDINPNGLQVGTGAGHAAWIDIGAGTTTLPPLSFNAGTNTTSPSGGDMEYNGTNLFFTRITGTRENVLVGAVVSGTFSTISTTTAVQVNINGTNYTIPTI